MACCPPPFFSFSCCGFILPCCSCFNYSFIFPNIFFIFLILFCFLFFDILLLHFFFLSSFFFFTVPRTLQDLGSQGGGWAQAPVVGALSPNSWTNREPQTPGNISRSEASWRSSSQHQDPALSNCLQTPVLDVTGQTTSKTGIQHHPFKKKIEKRQRKRQKNMLQSKEQGKNLQDQINEGEIGKLPEKEFRVMIVKMI